MPRRRTASSPQQQRRGDLAEQLGTRHIERNGASVIARNFHSRFGEIDLIAIDQSHLAFIEVRYRGIGSLGNAAASVTSRKQRKIIQAARFFLARYPQWYTAPMRFDVIAIDQIETQQHTLNWIKHAFDVGSFG